MKPITILIADDHKLIREAWTMVLNQEQRFNVIASCGTAASAIEMAKKHMPDIILLDISMPGLSGIEAVPLLIQAAPFSKIIGVSLHVLPSFVRKMMQHGAHGYVTKNSSKEEMIEAILKVYEGEKYICRFMKQEIAEQYAIDDPLHNKFSALSPREIEIIELIKNGLSSKDIAQRLLISVKTVEVHRYNILKKLNLKNTAALIDLYYRN